MIRMILALTVPAFLIGCISSSNPPPPPQNTVVVPPGSTVICQDGSAPPCR